MSFEELEKVKGMSYFDYVSYLKRKYGGVDDEGYVIINIANENRLRVSPEELRGE